MPKNKTFRNLLLTIGAIFIILGTGYNAYGWNTSGQEDYTLFFIGLTFMILAIFFKKDIE